MTMPSTFVRTLTIEDREEHLFHPMQQLQASSPLSKREWRIKHVTKQLSPSRSHAKCGLFLPSVFYEVKDLRVKAQRQSFRKMSKERRYDRFSKHWDNVDL